MDLTPLTSGRFPLTDRLLASLVSAGNIGTISATDTTPRTATAYCFRLSVPIDFTARHCCCTCYGTTGTVKGPLPYSPILTAGSFKLVWVCRCYLPDYLGGGSIGFYLFFTSVMSHFQLRPQNPSLYYFQVVLCPKWVSTCKGVKTPPLFHANHIPKGKLVSYLVREL